MMSLSPPDEKLLRTLWSRGPLTRGAARTDAETVRRLLSDGLIEEQAPVTKRGKLKLAVTERGREAAARIPPAKPSQGDVFRLVLMLRDEVEALRKLLTDRMPVADPAREEMNAENAESPRTLRSGDATSNPSTLTGFTESIVHAVATLDREERLSGLVPLPRLRQALGELGMTREAFDDSLLALEEQFVIDLKVANEPSRLPDREQGIETPERGLLYFVVLR